MHRIFNYSCVRATESGRSLRVENESLSMEVSSLAEAEGREGRGELEKDGRVVLRGADGRPGGDT